MEFLEIFLWCLVSVVYAVFGVLTGGFYGLGNTTSYANAKSFVVGLCWPLFWAWTLLYSFVYWVTRP